MVGRRSRPGPDGRCRTAPDRTAARRRGCRGGRRHQRRRCRALGTVDSRRVMPSDRTLITPERLSVAQTLRAAAAPRTGSAGLARSLTIGHANFRSLVPKLDLVQQTLSDHNIDVMCLTETWLSDRVTDRILVFPGYRLVRRDRQAGRARADLRQAADLSRPRTDWTDCSTGWRLPSLPAHRCFA